jgi:catechol 2,3-dioxygenase-like lactoylglutathione lyase family enzyme
LKLKSIYRIEAITLPVSDVDRAKAFYEKCGFHLDVDTDLPGGMRVVQFTPEGSDCSITFGVGFPQAEPGSYVNTYLVVPDIEVAHAELKERGVEVTDIYHWSQDGQTPGVDPNRGDFGSYASFDDPDGNSWLVQEVPSRGQNHPGD